MKSVNEGSTSLLRLSFTDTDGTAVTPSQIEYRIHCVQNGELIRDWTVADSADIVLTADDNAIKTRRTLEQHRVSVRATYAGTRRITGSDVINLR
jgi:hypothetical protein